MVSLSVNRHTMAPTRADDADAQHMTCAHIHAIQESVRFKDTLNVLLLIYPEATTLPVLFGSVYSVSGFAWQNIQSES